MITLRDIMTTNVQTVNPESSIRDAMDLLATMHVSGAPVLAGDEIVGIVSSTDLLEYVAGLPAVSGERNNDEERPISDPGTDSADDETVASEFYADLWTESEADVVARLDSAERDWNILDEHTVARAMTRAPICCLPPDTLVVEAAKQMQRQGIHRVLVTENGSLVGIVTTMDIVRAAAEHKLTARTFVFPRASRVGPSRKRT